MIVNSKTGLLVSGTVGKRPELRHVGQNDRPVLKFSLRYGSEQDASGKRRGKYIDVDVWENAEELDGMLAEDDPVIVTAQDIKSREYNGKTYHSISATGVYPSGGVVFRWIQQVIDMIPAAPAAPVNAPDGFQPVGEPVPFDTFEQPAADNVAAAEDPNTDFIDEEAEDLPF